MTRTKKLLESMIVNQAPGCIWIRDHHNMVTIHRIALRLIQDGLDIAARSIAKSNTKGDA